MLYTMLIYHVISWYITDVIKYLTLKNCNKYCGLQVTQNKNKITSTNQITITAGLVKIIPDCNAKLRQNWWPGKKRKLEKIK